MTLGNRKPSSSNTSSRRSNTSSRRSNTSRTRSNTSRTRSNTSRTRSNTSSRGSNTSSRGSNTRRKKKRRKRSNTSRKKIKRKKRKKKSRKRAKRANQNKIIAYLKNIDTKQIGNLVKKYEQKHKKISMYYLTEYNEKTKQIKGEKMFMGDFINRLKKDINETDFINQCKLIKKGGKGQFGGGLISANLFVTLSNITMVISTIYIVCVADSAALTGLTAGFSALLTGQCNSFAESSFRLIGFGNPVCNAWSSVVGNLLLALGGDPLAITKVTGIVVVIMKSPRWIPRLHGAFLKKLANVFVLGGMMDQDEFDKLDDITNLLPTLTGQERTMLELEDIDMSDVF